MFTGLVEAIGRVVAEEPDRDQVGLRLTIQCDFARDLAIGESVSINGTCLTVISHTGTEFLVQISHTTLRLTTLGQLVPGQRVNLERAVTAATRLGGHWVLGHVDTVGRVQSIERHGDTRDITVLFPEEYKRWVLPQGSITLDGVSLTIVDARANAVRVTIIPHTLTQTIIGEWQVGTAVNVEFDVLGKYVEHLLVPYRTPKEV
jgi:riboflavin synthase